MEKVIKFTDGSSMKDIAPHAEAARAIRNFDWKNSPNNQIIHVPFSGAIDGQFIIRFKYTSGSVYMIGLEFLGTIG